MDPWTLSVAGIALLPLIGLAFVLIDIRDAYTDLVRVQWWYPSPSIEHEQAKSIFVGQLARAANLVLISGMAAWYLLPPRLPRSGVATILYLVIGVMVADAIRARRARKKMIAYLQTNPVNDL